LLQRNASGNFSKHFFISPKAKMKLSDPPKNHPKKQQLWVVVVVYVAAVVNVVVVIYM